MEITEANIIGFLNPWDSTQESNRNTQVKKKRGKNGGGGVFYQTENRASGVEKL